MAELILATGAYSQSIARSTTGASGSSQLVISNGKSYFISQTIGQQGIIGMSTRNGHTIRQGFQQPPGSFLVGEPDVDSDLEAQVFPNPFQLSLDILFPGKTEQDILVFIHDLQGRIVYSKMHPATQLLYLSLGYISSGSYLLNVSAGNRSFTRKIIKH